MDRARVKYVGVLAGKAKVILQGRIMESLKLKRIRRAAQVNIEVTGLCLSRSRLRLPNQPQVDILYRNPPLIVGIVDV